MDASGLSSPLIDACYKAVHDRSAWSGFLKDFSEAVDSYTGAIFIPPIDGFSTIPFVVHNTAPLVKVMQQYSKYSNQAPLLIRAREMGIVPGVFTNTDVMPWDELKKTDWFENYMRPADIGFCLSMFVDGNPTTSAPPLCMQVGRRLRAPDYSDEHREIAEEVFPHFRRAARMALHLEQSTGFDPAVGQAFDLMATPSILFGLNGRILHANKAVIAHCASDAMMSIRGGEVHLAEPDLDGRLAELVKRAVGIDRDWNGRSGGEIYLLAGADQPPRVCVVVPLGPDNPFAGWISAVRAIVYILAPGELKVSTDGLSRIRDLYGLTQAEAEVGAMLIAGKGPQEIAAARGIQMSTVREQIKRVLLKTDCHRQAELSKLRPLVQGPG